MNILPIVIELCNKYDVTITFTNECMKCDKYIDVIVIKNNTNRIIRHNFYLSDIEDELGKDNVIEHIEYVLTEMCKKL